MKDDVSGQVVSTIVTCLVTTFLKRFDVNKQNETVSLSETDLKIRKDDGTLIEVHKERD